MNNNNPYLSVFILASAMAMGITMALGTLVYMKLTENIPINMEYNNPMIIAGSLVGILAIPAGLFYYKKSLTKAREKTTEEDKLTAYRTLVIIRSAIWESAAAFNLVVFFLLSSWVSVFIAGGIIIMFLVNLPFPQRIKNDLEI